jgi:hypothetical protein
MCECSVILLGVTEFVPLISRLLVATRRELLLPLLMPDRHQTGIVFDPCVPAGPTKTINGRVGKLPEAGTRHATHCRQAKQTTEGGIPELIAGSHLLARLMFQRIRPHAHSGLISEQSCSPPELQPTPISIASPDITTPPMWNPAMNGSGDCAEVSARAPIPPEIETLFTQLVRRRLWSRAPQETK